MDDKYSNTSSQTISSWQRNGRVFVVTYSGPRIGNYHLDIAAAFSHSVILKASNVDIRKFIASNNIQKLVGAGKTVIFVTSITDNGVIKGLKKAFEQVRCVSWWIHCGLTEELASINLGQGRSIVPKWHKLLNDFPNKFVSPSLAGDSLPEITHFEFLLYKPPPFEVLFQQIVSTPVPPLTKVSAVFLEVVLGSVTPNNPLDKVLKYLALITYSNVIHLNWNDESEENLLRRLHDVMSDLPIFGKPCIIVCSNQHPLSSFTKMKKLCLDLIFKTPFEGGVFLETLPYDNGARANTRIQFFRELALRHTVLCMLNGDSAPKLSSAPSNTSAPNLSSAPHSNMQEVD
jgi:hypothetical protein